MNHLIYLFTGLFFFFIGIFATFSLFYTIKRSFFELRWFYYQKTLKSLKKYSIQKSNIYTKEYAWSNFEFDNYRLNSQEWQTAKEECYTTIFLGFIGLLSVFCCYLLGKSFFI